MNREFGSPVAPASATEEKLDAKHDFTVKSLERKGPKNSRSRLTKALAKVVARSVGFVLTLGEEADWHGLTIVLLRLPDEQRAALSFACLKSLSFQQIEDVVNAATENSYSPTTPLFNVVDEALSWVTWVPEEVLEIFGFIILKALSDHTRRKLIEATESRGASHG